MLACKFKDHPFVGNCPKICELKVDDWIPDDDISGGFQPNVIFNGKSKGKHRTFLLFHIIKISMN